MVQTRPHHPTRQTANRWRSGFPVMALITCAVLFVLTLSAGLLQAEESKRFLNARKKLIAMVTGDITRSLAVAKSGTGEASSDPKSVRSASKGFPGSAVYAMGQNTFGQLGNGTAIDTHTPVLLAPDVFGGPVASGLNHTLVIDRDGNLWVTGDDVAGQFGDGPVNSSTATLTQTSETGIKTVAAGTYHSLILTHDGMILGAGEGTNGELGNGGTDTNAFSAIDVTGARKVAAVSNNSFVITDLGELFGFGANLSGELGVGTVGIAQLTPARVLAGGVTDVAPGNNHTLALMADGMVMAAGLNTYGQFGDATTDSSTVFKAVVPSEVKAVAAGSGFSLFLMADGSLYGAGVNDYGQLGTGDTSIRSSLHRIVDGGVAAIAAGNKHSLYVTDSGDLWGMGNNGNGQLGLGDFVPRLAPTLIESGGVAGVSAGFYNTFYIKNIIISLEIEGLAMVYEGATANYHCYAHWADGTTTRVTEAAVWFEDSSTATIELNSGILNLASTPAPETIRISAGYFGLTATKDVAVNKLPSGSALYGCGDNSYSHLGLDTIVDQSILMEISPDKAISLAGGLNHSLYVREDGAVFSMGDNTYGQLGTSDTIPRTTPALLDLPGPAIGVGAGDNHSFIVFRDGSLRAMGQNNEGQLGDGTTTNQKTPTKIRHVGVIQADGGLGHSVFLTSGGEVWTMGRNLEGQLGSGNTTSSHQPFLAYTGTDATAVAAGKNHTLFRTQDADLWGMGDNTYGQLGLISSVIAQLAPTTLVVSNVTHFAAGGNHSLYVSSSNDLYATGTNAYGQLGNGSAGSDVFGFTQLSGYTGVTEVYAGDNFSMFRTGSGIIDSTWYAMGDNTHGQFGNNTFTTTAVPVLLSHSNIAGFSLGGNHTLSTRASLQAVQIRGLDNVYESDSANFECLALWDDGSTTVVTNAAVWSENSGTAAIDQGALDLSVSAEGETIRISVTYDGKTDFRDVTVIRTPTGAALYGFGDSASHQLGLNTNSARLTPAKISDDPVISAAGGIGHSLFVLENGSVYAMGDNLYGQLGVGDTITRTVPTRVNLTNPAIAVAAGDDHSLIICRDGSLFGMGSNVYGQLGIGEAPQALSPTEIVHSGVIRADGGSNHSVFLTTDGEVWAMGDNTYGQLGNTTGIWQSNAPYQAYTGTPKANSVAAGARHTIFRTDDAAMRGMGDNSNGQLGLGHAVSTRNAPTLLVPSGTAVIAAGENHTLYASEARLLYVTGANNDGQLGSGSAGSNVFTFMQRTGYTGVTDVIAGSNFSLFRTGSLPADHIWYGMGNSNYGQLGLGTTGIIPGSVMLNHSIVNKNQLVAAGHNHTFLTRSGLPGDIDGDLQITLADTLAALKILAGSYQEPIASFADANQDGKIDFYEVNDALKKAGGL